MEEPRIDVTFVETKVFTKRIVELGLDEALKELQERRYPTKRRRRSQMDTTLFAELLESTTQALEHAQGKRELRTTILPAAPKPMRAVDVRRLRTKLKASQAVFAYCLNVSTKLVQAWESERRTPEGPALLLLRIAERNPGVVFGRSEAATTGHIQPSAQLRKSVSKQSA